ncbi:MAG: bifunctional sugar-1-phosphate nucleotidylyltransferase/acetyltransferase [Sulfolobales archaeon]
MELIVLAGGRGERLKPITDTRPKPLIPILGRPLLERTLDLFIDKISRVVVVAEYRYDDIKRFIDEYTRDRGVEIEIVRQGKELGTGHAVQVALSHTRSDEVVVVYGDLYLEKSLVEKIISAPRDSLVGLSVPNPWDYGVLLVEGDRVLRVLEKPQTLEIPSDIINAGVYKFSSKTLELVNEIGFSERGEIELTDLVKIARERGIDIRLVRSSVEEWSEIGRPWDLLEIHKKLLQRLNERIIKGKTDPRVVIEGPVYIGEGAIVKGSTYIEGPVYIDDEAVIGPNSYIRPYTYVGRRARIGFSTEVKESVILEEARLPHLNYAGDSVICEKVNLGAGTLIANLRFDEQPVKVTLRNTRVSSGRVKLGAFIGGHVKTGINVSILPGVKIGAYSIIYPGVVVGKDVEYGSVIRSSTV